MKPGTTVIVTDQQVVRKPVERRHLLRRQLIARACAGISALPAIAFTLASCAAPYAKVSPRKPHLTGPRGSGTLASVEQTLDQAIHEHRAHPLQAMGHCLDALESITRRAAPRPD